MLFALVEKTAGPWHGKVWRCEEMSADEAVARNRGMTVMQWEEYDGDGPGSDSGRDITRKDEVSGRQRSTGGAVSRPSRNRRGNGRIANRTKSKVAGTRKT